MKVKSSSAWQIVVEQSIALLVLAIVAIYIYVLFAVVPYPGFDWGSPNSQVIKVFAEGTSLQLGDQLIRIGNVSMSDFSSRLRLTVLGGVQPGDRVELFVQRGNKQLPIAWVVPPLTWDEFNYRLSNQWWYGALFWLIGEATLLFLRPKDGRWRLLVAFNFLTALWFTTSASSSKHFWDSAILLRVFTWGSVPIYLFLHWVFPKPFTRLPLSVRVSGYLIFFALAVAQWFELLPPQLYLIGFLLSLFGSLILLVAHFFKRDHRPELRPLIVAGSVAFVPLIVVLLFAIPNSLSYYQAIALFALPLLPASYFYAAYRKQLGGAELRANRVISIYLFLILMTLVLFLVVPLVVERIKFPGDTIIISIATTLTTFVLATFTFLPFQRFVEHNLLGIRLPPENLHSIYPARIVDSLDRQTLVSLIQDEIMPSLLVRESALMILDEKGLTTVYADGIDSRSLPSSNDIPSLLVDAATNRVVADDTPQQLAWVKLVLPLKIGQKLIGLWLLGRCDPDDFYSQPIVATLQSLANQTAIALNHIKQAESLAALYQNDIALREQERFDLARELHDNVLQQLAIWRQQAMKDKTSPELDSTYEQLARSLRRTIGMLRPVMLSLGLNRALQSLMEELSDRADEAGITVKCDIPQSEVRYDEQVELHLYRIVQQAVENALRHAQAKTITLSGGLEDGRIDLKVEDDGVGFPLGEKLDLVSLALQKHFGVVGMFERAAIINAVITIDSAPGRGTCLRIVWQRA